MKKMKWLLATMTLAFAVNISSAQNIAYIYRDSVLQSSPAYMSGMRKLDSLRVTYSREVEAATKQVQEKVGTLLKGYKPVENESLDSIRKRMKPEDTTRLGLLIQENNLVSSKTKTYESMLQAVFARDIQPILDRVNASLEKYAKANKLDYIWMMEEVNGGLAYINKSKNVTKAVIALLKQ